MAWRNQGTTGSNDIPLGRRRFAGDEEDESRTASPSSLPDGPKRGRSPVRGKLPETFFLMLNLITSLE